MVTCQAFGKRPTDWIRLPQTERYISALKVKCENLNSLIETRKGNSNEFQEEISLQKLLESDYTNERGKNIQCLN